MSEKILKFKIATVWKGEYNSSTTYDILDEVSFTSDNNPNNIPYGNYRSLKNNNTSPLSDQSAWRKILDLQTLQDVTKDAVAENNKIKENETIRKANEEKRIAFYDKTVTEENKRISNENIRKNNEIKRQDAETNRETKEIQRQQNEINRNTAEQVRESNETKRESNEGTSTDTPNKNGSRWARFNAAELERNSINKIKNITYNEFKLLIDRNTLVPGQQYLITDFVNDFPHNIDTPSLIYLSAKDGLSNWQEFLIQNNHTKYEVLVTALTNYSIKDDVIIIYNNKSYKAKLELIPERTYNYKYELRPHEFINESLKIVSNEDIFIDDLNTQSYRGIAIDSIKDYLRSVITKNSNNICFILTFKFDKLSSNGEKLFKYTYFTVDKNTISLNDFNKTINVDIHFGTFRTNFVSGEVSYSNEQTFKTKIDVFSKPLNKYKIINFVDNNLNKFNYDPINIEFICIDFTIWNMTDVRSFEITTNTIFTQNPNIKNNEFNNSLLIFSKESKIENSTFNNVHGKVSGTLIDGNIHGENDENHLVTLTNLNLVKGADITVNQNGVYDYPYPLDYYAHFINDIQYSSDPIPIQKWRLDELQNNGKLFPGQEYKLTDYRPSVDYDISICQVNFDFNDLIVTAIDSSTLSKNAKLLQNNNQSTYSVIIEDNDKCGGDSLPYKRPYIKQKQIKNFELSASELFTFHTYDLIDTNDESQYRVIKLKLPTYNTPVFLVIMSDISINLINPPLNSYRVEQNNIIVDDITLWLSDNVIGWLNIIKTQLNISNNGKLIYIFDYFGSDYSYIPAIHSIPDMVSLDVDSLSGDDKCFGSMLQDLQSLSDMDIKSIIITKCVWSDVFSIEVVIECFENEHYNGNSKIYSGCMTESGGIDWIEMKISSNNQEIKTAKQFNITKFIDTVKDNEFPYDAANINIIGSNPIDKNIYGLKIINPEPNKNDIIIPFIAYQTAFGDNGSAFIKNVIIKNNKSENKKNTLLINNSLNNVIIDAIFDNSTIDVPLQNAKITINSFNDFINKTSVKPINTVSAVTNIKDVLNNNSYKHIFNALEGETNPVSMLTIEDIYKSIKQ